MAPPHSQGSHAKSCKESAQSSVASALNFVCVPACCLLPTAPVCQPRPVGLLQPAIDQFPRRQRPCREPASSVNERSLPARPATGGTESTRATGKVAAELRAMTRTNMPAELLRPVTSNHPFLTHAARTRRCGVLLRDLRRAAQQSVHIRRSISAANLLQTVSQ